MEKRITTVIPAQPGYFAVFFDKAEKRLICDYAIIAWGIEHRPESKDGSFGYYTTPICLDGEVDRIDNYVGIKYPDGSIEVSATGKKFAANDETLIDSLLS